MLTRRAFLHHAALTAAASALPACAVWPARGAAKGGPLRLVFFTDVHARVEWYTPLALERATESGLRSATA